MQDQKPTRVRQTVYVEPDLDLQLRQHALAKRQHQQEHVELSDIVNDALRAYLEEENDDEEKKVKISFYLPESLVTHLTEQLIPRYNLSHKLRTGKKVNRNDIVWFLLENIDEGALMQLHIPHRRSE